MTETQTTRILTQHDALFLGRLIDACRNGTEVVRYFKDTGRALRGIPRNLVKGPGDQAHFLGPDDDVRDSYLWVTSTFEHFWRVCDLLEEWKTGVFAISGEGTVNE